MIEKNPTDAGGKNYKEGDYFGEKGQPFLFFCLLLPVDIKSHYGILS